MGLEGLEPSWVLPRRILSPLRLPIPPQALWVQLDDQTILPASRQLCLSDNTTLPKDQELFWPTNRRIHAQGTRHHAPSMTMLFFTAEEHIWILQDEDDRP